MPQLHSQRMQAVGCQSVAVMSVSLRRAPRARRSRSWRWTLSSGSGSRRARAMTSAPSIAAITSTASSAARAAPTPSAVRRFASSACHRANAAAACSCRSESGVAGLDRDGDDRAAGPEVGADELLAVVVDQRVEQLERAAARCDPAATYSPAKSVASRSSCWRPPGKWW